MFSIQMLLTFQSNCAEGLHFSAFIVIGTAINQLETKVSLKTICCLRLFVVVYKHVMFNKIKEEEEHEKTCFAVFPGCYVEIRLFLLNLFLFVCF